MTTPYATTERTGRAWIIEALVDMDERGDLVVDLHMFPVNVTGSLTSVPSVTASLIGQESDGDDM